jgi:hypothetical protein
MFITLQHTTSEQNNMAALRKTREQKVFGSCSGQDSKLHALFVIHSTH